MHRWNCKTVIFPEHLRTCSPAYVINLAQISHKIYVQVWMFLTLTEINGLSCVVARQTIHFKDYVIISQAPSLSLVIYTQCGFIILELRKSRERQSYFSVASHTTFKVGRPPAMTHAIPCPTYACGHTDPKHRTPQDRMRLTYRFLLALSHGFAISGEEIAPEYPKQ